MCKKDRLAGGSETLLRFFLWLPVNHILPIHHWRILPPSAAVRPSSEAAAGAGSWGRGDPRGGSDESAAPQ